MTVEEIYALPINQYGWRVLPTGNWVKLGNGVTLGNGVKLSETPCQVQCHPYGVYPHSTDRIGVGCIVREIAYWERERDPDELAEHPECQPWENYRDAIGLVAKWMRANEMGFTHEAHRALQV